MKRFLMAAAIVGLLTASSVADGLPSSSKLASFGLSSLKIATDDEGHQVRGKGFGAGYFAFRVGVQEGVFIPARLGPGVFVNNPANAAAASIVGAYTFGQDPRAAAGDLVSGAGGIDPVAPGSPLTVNLATPNGVWVSSTFGIAFGNGN